VHETAPTFEDTWAECLANSAHHRIAVGDDDIRDRDVCASVARSWHSEATDKPHALVATQPFFLARERILTLFDLLFWPEHTNEKGHVDAALAQLHGINFPPINLEKFDCAPFSYLYNLGKCVGETEPDRKVRFLQMH
ncbi:hypothetical protein HOY80DRAFT_886621, partial [Tuber brumale]